MLIEYIERMRKEPKEVRRRAVFVWTLVIVGIILLLYVLYLGLGAAADSGPVDTPSNIARPYESGE